MAITKVTNSLVAVNAIHGTLIADNAITAVHIAQNQVTSVQIADGSITSTQLGANSVDTAELVSGSIDTIHIADDQVTTAKIADLNVTTGKIANNAITSAKIPDGSITATQLDSSATPTFGTITTTGQLKGPASFTIDPATHGDNTGTLVVAGNLQVDGTTTTINSTTVAIDDLNFSIATDAADSAAANGAGITIGGASATWNYVHSNTSWTANKRIIAPYFTSNTNAGSTLYAVSTTRSGSGTSTPDIWGSSDTFVIGYAAGSKAVSFNSTGAHFAGNIGVGAASASTVSLHIRAPASDASNYAIDACNASGNTRFLVDGSGTQKFYGSDNAETARFTDGKLGIGTTSPDHLLEVETTSSSVAPKIGFRNTQGGTQIGMPADTNALYFVTGDTERMRIESDGNTHVLAGFAVRGTNTPASGKGIEMHQSGDDMHIYAYDRDNSAVKNLTLQNPGGNVGIGTTSPASLLHVDKSFSGTLVTLHQTAGASSSDRGLDVETSSTGTTVQRWINSGTELMRVGGNGNVGIGTTSPGFKLTVGGGIGANQSTAYASMTGQLGFGNDYSDTQRGPNKIVLQNDGSWIAGLGISNGSTDFYSGGNFTFSTGTSLGTEKMRLNSNGSLMIGTTTNPTYAHKIYAVGSSIPDGIAHFRDTDASVALSNSLLSLQFSGDNDATSGSFVYMTDGNGAIGSITAASGTSVSFNTTSDERLKKNIVDASPQLDILKNIKVREFDWKRNDHHELGLIAQEIKDIIPNVVQQGGDDETKHPFGVDYGKLTPYLIKAMQEQQTIIEDLKSRIETLEG